MIYNFFINHKHRITKMVFSSTTFLFLFLPAVFFFYWLPEVCSKTIQLFCKKSLDNHDLNLALYSQTANATSPSILEEKKESEGCNLKYSRSKAGTSNIINILLFTYFSNKRFLNKFIYCHLYAKRNSQI